MSTTHLFEAGTLTIDGIRLCVCGLSKTNRIHDQPTPPAEGETTPWLVLAVDGNDQCYGCRDCPAKVWTSKPRPGAFSHSSDCPHYGKDYEKAEGVRAKGETAEGLSAERLRCASCGAADFYVCGCYDKCLCGHDRRSHTPGGTCTHAACVCRSGLHGQAGGETYCTCDPHPTRPHEPGCPKAESK